MSNSIIITVVETNGTIDESATEAVFRENLRTLIEGRTALTAERAEQQERIATAVLSVLDRFPGKRINLPHLASLAVVHMGVAPEDFKRMTDLCLDYVRANSKGAESLFEMGKGSKHGGVARRVQPAAADQDGGSIEMTAEFVAPRWEARRELHGNP
jgi:hypothetical protein